MGDTLSVDQIALILFHINNGQAVHSAELSLL